MEWLSRLDIFQKPRVAARDSEADSGVPLATQDKSRSKLVPAKRKVSEMPTSSDDEVKFPSYSDRKSWFMVNLAAWQGQPTENQSTQN